MINDGFIELQEKNCKSVGGKIKQTLYIGVWRNAMCPSIIDWYKEGVDFVISSKEGTIEVSREDLDNTSNYAQTESGKVSMSRNLTIKPTLDSKLVQRLNLITIENEGSNGEVFKSYSDGGFHFQLVLENEKTGAEWTQLGLNAKCANFMDVFYSDFKSDTEFSMDFTIENDYIHYMDGLMGDNYALPQELEQIQINYTNITNTSTDLTISGIELVDPELATFDDSIQVVVKDEETSETLGTQSTTSGDITLPIDFSTNKNLKIDFMYRFNTNLYIVAKSELYASSESKKQKTKIKEQEK